MIQKRVWENKIREILRGKSPSQQETIFRLISLALHYNYENDDQLELYNALGLTNYIAFTKTFNGKTVKSIKESELRNLLVFILCFYYVEIENLKFSDIREKLPFDIDNNTAISYGIRIKKMTKEVKNEIANLFLNEVKKNEE